MWGHLFAYILEVGALYGHPDANKHVQGHSLALTWVADMAYGTDVAYPLMRAYVFAYILELDALYEHQCANNRCRDTVLPAP